jgi:hypothetical protein
MKLAFSLFTRSFIASAVCVCLSSSAALSAMRCCMPPSCRRSASPSRSIATLMAASAALACLRAASEVASWLRSLSPVVGQGRGRARFRTGYRQLVVWIGLYGV